MIGSPMVDRERIVSLLRTNTLSSGQKQVIDWKEIDAKVRATLGTEEAPFDGKIPVEKLQEAALERIKNDKRRGLRFTYVFNGLPLGSTLEEFVQFCEE